jgi:hypothetical protein
MKATSSTSGAGKHLTASLLIAMSFLWVIKVILVYDLW